MRALAIASRRVGGLRAARLASVRTYATSVPATPEDGDPQLTENGYQNVPQINKQYRPARGWQDPQMRRNFDEPVCAWPLSTGVASHNSP